MIDIICRVVQNREELQESFTLRKKVFVDEQKLFKRTDRDRNDKHAFHIIALHKEKIIGTVRVFHKGRGIWYGSRLAVLKKYRGRVGKALIQKAEEFVNLQQAQQFCAAIQLRNAPLFKRLGWVAIGPIITYRGQLHQVMAAPLHSKQVKA
jgi:putative N-acetyltransferase (TIGR04045 family)